MCFAVRPCGRRSAGWRLWKRCQRSSAPEEGRNDEVANFFCFVAEERANVADPQHRSTKQIRFDDLTLKLGSIHSVKGKSVDGILVVESEIWKGPRADEQCFDLGKVLPRAFGVTDEAFTGIGITAATNVFVGVTRPRELLGLARRQSEAATIIKPAMDQGWKTVDLLTPYFSRSYGCRCFNRNPCRVVQLSKPRCIVDDRRQFHCNLVTVDLEWFYFLYAVQSQNLVRHRLSLTTHKLKILLPSRVVTRLSH